MKLPKSIIKKYGITKKAWSVFRGTKTKTRSVKTMARKKFKRSRNKGSNKISIVQADAIIYGALRAKVSNALSPIIGKIPLGNLADEVGMGAIDYLIAKNTKGMLRNIAMKGLIIENARVGEAIIDGSFLGNTTTSSNWFN